MCDLCGAEGRTSRWDIGHGVQAVCDSCERNPQRVRDEIVSRFPKVREVTEHHVGTIRL